MNTRSDPATRLNSSVGKPDSNKGFATNDVSLRGPESNKLAFGPNSIIDTHYFENGTDRALWIHGGGTGLGAVGSQAPYQTLVPTFGCARMYNADVQSLAGQISAFKDQTGLPVSYLRNH